MDIAPYIIELLLEHDCVIIPGFGGLVCNYRPAEIHPVAHTIHPPSKAVSFNRNLIANDGLLINHIAFRRGISFDLAVAAVQDWVAAAKVLLKANEELRIAKVGRLQRDIEGTLQFFPDACVNYLKSSYGLRVVSAAPVLRGKQITFTEKFSDETAAAPRGRSTWKVAAVIALLFAAAGIAQMMWMGVQITSLQLDEAGVEKTLSTVFKSAEPDIQPLPVENTPLETGTDSISLAILPSPSPISENKITEAKPGDYYIIIGAFIEEQNIEAARLRLQQRYPDSVILVEKGKRLTKVGFRVGSDFETARQELIKAQGDDDSSCWLLRR